MSVIKTFGAIFKGSDQLCVIVLPNLSVANTVTFVESFPLCSAESLYYKGGVNEQPGLKQRGDRWEASRVIQKAKLSRIWPIK